MDSAAILRTVPLFAEALSAEQLRLLASASRPAFFRAGTRLMTQGDFGGAMFVIVAGEVAVTFIAEDGRETTVATLGPHEVVGEMSLFTGDRRTATVSALSNVDALEIGKSSIERVFARAPELSDRFADVLARRQAELNAVSGSRESRESFAGRARKAFAGVFARGG